MIQKPENDLKVEITSPPTAEELRKLVLEELWSLGFEFQDGQIIPRGKDRDFHRKLHAPAREIILTDSRNWIASAWSKYESFFASGSEVNPEKVFPKLVEVTTQKERDIFRIARYTWSLPYTKGYGRRLQFLLIDESNEKLIGILGLQSPPLSYPARDRMFSFNGQKTEKVNQTMDIYTLGAIPPYSNLLGGKLLALAAMSNEIRKAYKAKYENRVTEMEGRVLPAELVALTTTSAYGRSSIYNRLSYNGEVKIKSIGFTEGYGAFHFERVYPKIREFLEAQGIDTTGGFGKGPRIKWQTMVRALEKIGLGSEMLKHHIKREAFLFPLIKNLKNYFEDIDEIPEYIDVNFRELTDFWKRRWLLPRAKRVEHWKKWEKHELEKILFTKPLSEFISTNNQNNHGIEGIK